jgi:bis(5'-nucleosyl)-tetraphosphatase (symmetrical)
MRLIFVATYAIGDIQGCYDSLMALLDKIDYDDNHDTLWFAGDLVNRGPKSLKTLRFIKGLGDKAVSVLGNHDLHLLALYFNEDNSRKSDTLEATLNADDSEELMHWLRCLPLVHYDEGLNALMVHAGIPPSWSAKKSLKRSLEVEAFLQSPDFREFFKVMYGNTPDQWSKSLAGMDRLRAIVNYFTRMRFCTQQGHLDLLTKEGLNKRPEGFSPWFELERKAAATRIFFGHWAALEGKADDDNVFALDTGCVWGGKLSCIRLEDENWFRVSAQENNI